MWIERIRATVTDWAADPTKLNRASLVLFWSDLRHYLESINFPEQYKTLRFFADFILHANLDRRSNFQPLQDFAKFVESLGSEKDEEMARRLAQMIGVDHLTAELGLIEQNTDLSFDVLRKPGMYDRFLNLLVGELVGKSVDGTQYLYKQGQLDKQRAEILFGASYRWGVTKVELAPVGPSSTFEMRVHLITGWHTDENGAGRIVILFPIFELRS